jgi:hypothetical protein
MERGRREGDGLPNQPVECLFRLRYVEQKNGRLILQTANVGEPMVCYSVCLRIFLVFLLLFPSSTVQDDNPESSELVKEKIPFLCNEVTRVFVPEVGSFVGKTSTISGFQIADPIAELAILRSDEVVQQLEFMASQSSKLEPILRSADKLIADTRGKIAIASNQSQLKQIVAWHKGKSLEISSKFEDILLPHQREDIKQLGEQVLLRKLGMQAYLSNVADRSELALSKSERKRLAKIASEQLDVYSEKGKKAVEDSLNKLLSPLDEEKKAKISIAALIGDGIASFDVLHAQLRISEGAIREATSEFKSLRRPAIYLPGSDGSPELYARGRGAISCDFERLKGHKSLLTYLESGPVKLNESQLQEVDRIRSEIAMSELRMSTYFDSAPNPWFASENIIDMQMTVCSQVEKQLDQILSPAQIDNVKTRIRDSSLRRFGLVYLLTEGPLRKTLGVSSEERKEIRKRAQELKKEMREKSREWVNSINNSMVGALDKRNREIVTHLLGDEAQFGGATLFVVGFE